MPRIIIHESRCKGCALCTIACPRKLITLSDQINRQGFLPAIISEEGLAKCTSCALCAQMCPEVAITVRREQKRQGDGRA